MAYRFEACWRDAILNAKGNIGDISPELKGFLALVTGSEKYLEGSFAERVQRQVILARKNADWRMEYMDWKMTLRHERYLGKEEGIIVGRAEGKAERDIELIIGKVKKQKSLETIADEMESDVETIRPIWTAVTACAPDYNIEAIMEKLWCQAP